MLTLPASAIGSIMSALRGLFPGRRAVDRDKPLAKLDERLLDDLGITREQAYEIDREDELRLRSRRRTE